MSFKAVKNKGVDKYLADVNRLELYKKIAVRLDVMTRKVDTISHIISVTQINNYKINKTKINENQNSIIQTANIENQRVRGCM